MLIRLADYQPFAYSKALKSYGQKSYEEKVTTYLGTLKKIGKIALAILGYLPALSADLLTLPIAWAYRRSFSAKPIAPSSPTPTKPTFPLTPLPVAPSHPRTQETKGQQTREQQNRERGISLVCEQIVCNPYPRLPYPSLSANDSIEFLLEALRYGLYRNKSIGSHLLKELIRNEGVPNDPDQDPPLNIYQWSAGCLIAYYLLCRHFHHDWVARFYPAVHPDRDSPKAQAHEEQIQEIRRQFKQLSSPTEKAFVLLSLVDSTNLQGLPPSPKARELVNLIQGQALAMTQDASFLLKIYQPTTQRINIL